MKHTNHLLIKSRWLALTFLFLGLTSLLQAQLLSPTAHPKFINPLPAPAVIDATNGGTYNIEMRSVVQWLGLVDANNLPLQTTVWGYGPVNNVTYPGPTFWTMQGNPVDITWKNNLPNNHLLPIDMSIHVAHPTTWFGKGVPTVAHLHGGHTESASDGLPDAWFTSNYKYKGGDFIKKKYHYANDQEAATLWYHDHALGITRLNVYAGLAGFYLHRDANELSLGLPSGPYEREIVFQDRDFDANGQLVLPATGADQGDCQIGGPNGPDPIIPNPLEFPAPGAPSINAEFFGQYIIINGIAWPKLDVEPRQYRFRLLNGSDSRFYYLEFQTPSNVLPFLQIGSDDGLLPYPVSLNNLLLAPGERADVIVDFTGLENTTINLYNYGPDEPFGTLEDLVDTVVYVEGVLTERPTSKLMRFNVILPFNPAVPNTNFTGSPDGTTGTSLRSVPIVEPNPTITRKLVLFEGRDKYCRLRPQLGILDPTRPLLNGSLMWDEEITERPALNAVENWEIYNTTADAHPIHLHQVAFQILERHSPLEGEEFSFTGAVEFNAAGDPVAGGSKQVLTGDVAIKANTAQVIAPNEKGWKDTGVIPPGGVMRVAARFDLPGKYVWHCHILSHEDHEMMRPFFVGQLPGPIGRELIQASADTQLDDGNVEFELLQAYPNPLRDLTEISYNIPEETSVTLTISDVQGRVVRQLAAGLHEAGLYRLNWDGRDNSGRRLPAGMYNYTMQSSNKIQTRRLVITN